MVAVREGWWMAATGTLAREGPESGGEEGAHLGREPGGESEMGSWVEPGAGERVSYAGTPVRPLWPWLVREVEEGPAPTAPWPLYVREAAPESVPAPDRVPAGTSGIQASEASATPNAPETSSSSAGLSLDPASATSDSDSDPEDELFLLGERCAELYLRAEALHARALGLLAEFHRREGWKGTGFSSTAEWLAWRVGIGLHAARERVRAALALEDLPLTSEAMQRGELSFAKVRALTRVARPENEATLLAFARAGSAANLERVVRGWKALEGKSELTAEQIRHRSRRFSAWVAEDGMVEVRGRLDPEVGALLMRAVEVAADALFRDGGSEGGAGGEQCGCGGKGRTEEEERAGMEGTTPEQRRADALGLVAERALTAGFGGTGASSTAPVSGTRAERYQVMLHVDVGTLREEEGKEAAEGGGDRSELEDGTRVPAGTSRRIACDAGVVRVALGEAGQVLGAGRRSRTVPPALRRALEARDRGCRFPGCGLRFTDAHHVKHWADGGETSLGNLVLLCRRHHRAVHEGGVRVCIDRDGQVVFFSPRGKALRGAPVAPVLPVTKPGPGSLEGAPVEGGAEPGLGSEPDPCTAAAKAAASVLEPMEGEEGGEDGGQKQPEPDPHRSDPFPGAAHFTRDPHIPWALEAAAWEALDSG